MRYCHFGVSPVNYSDSDNLYIISLVNSEAGWVRWEEAVLRRTYSKVAPERLSAQRSCFVLVLNTSQSKEI